MPSTTATADPVSVEAPPGPRAARLSWVGRSGFDGGALGLVVWLAVLLVVLWAITHVAMEMGPVRYVQSLA